MKLGPPKISNTLLILILITGSVLIGSWYSQRESAKVDPSNTKVAAVDDQEGIGNDAGADESLMAPGTIRINDTKQQVIGVRVSQVEKTSLLQTLRLLGRVAPDENRIFRLNASTELWIRKVYPATPGSVVKKDEPLLAFYATNFLSAAGSYMYALNTLDRQRASKTDTPDQLTVTNFQIRQAVESLQNLGVSDLQIEQMARTRKVGDLVDLRSPTEGVLLSRNATLGQWIGPGAELYKIADLRRIWILVDVFENEIRYLKPGMEVNFKIPYQKQAFQGKVSDVLPQFDPITRSLKVRLEADNRDYILQPDMFVDVEFPIQLPAAITVPADAILDSGLKKTVFVERGNGVFEPREVETGWRAGNRVEIVRGLEVGERIATSGTFLIDSESKLQLAAQGMYTKLSKDPVCGAEVSQAKAEKAGRKIEYKDKKYYFDSDECKQKFEKEPEKYVKE
jgi:membrane fusion protein, copper/silver efflux system